MKASDKYMDPTLDWSFKKMFLTPGHEDILKTFLNDVLKGELVIHEIQSVLPVSKDEPYQKSILFDVFCTSKDGTKFIIEMQKKDEKDFLQRIDFYRSRTIAEQLKTSGRYGEIVPVIVVGVCDFPILTQIFGQEAQGLFFERLGLTGRLSGLVPKKFPSLFVLLDLPAYRAKGFPHVSELEDWFALFTCKSHEAELGSRRPPLTKALDSLEFDMLPPLERAYAEKALDEARIAAGVLAAAMAEKDAAMAAERAAMAEKEAAIAAERASIAEKDASMAAEREDMEAERAAMAVALEARMSEEKITMAKNLLLLNIPLEAISKATGLSLQELKNLKSS